MTLTRLIEKANESPELERLAREAAAAPQAAFVSASLRPFVVAALLQSDEFTGRPALVVAGDDRGARDLAADLRAFLGPRVRFYPARGVRYESHLAPPPHLVGLRVAALDAARAEDAPAVVVASAVALMERVPDPELRPHGFTLRVGEEIDLEETLERLVELGYEREEQVFERGQFAVRGGILDIYPATEERAVRIELFGDEVESLRWFSTFTQRSLSEAERGRDRARRRARRRVPRAGRDRCERGCGRTPRRRRDPARGPVPLVPRPGPGRGGGGGRGGRGASARRSPTIGRTSPPAFTRPTPITCTCRRPTSSSRSSAGLR